MAIVSLLDKQSSTCWEIFCDEQFLELNEENEPIHQTKQHHKNSEGK